MKKFIFKTMLICAALVAAFFLGAIFQVANPYLGLAMTLGGSSLLVLGYVLADKKSSSDNED